jgi:hypothetical protein
MDVSTAPIYNYLIDGGNELDILIYSGDDDSVCGTIGTQDWIYDLGYAVSSKWQPYVLNGQTAGYLTQFSGNLQKNCIYVHLYVYRFVYIYIYVYM